ncbi:polyprenyl synthetase family protein [Tunicatimonas pelagia]|uniref:polyprenyl synthetase family protein n=1 Tax=Tunicatimonas pelagia TaxID=931531 RepID=UPI0026654914|nr:polyprenyl synthetase family protein [Tunicatimonas pelagia]WKN42019.1 polyprenyl synthetase family protein [Tunicatimonas pelagia]
MSLPVNSYREQINQRLSAYSFGQSPNELYDPIRYILSLGGKRLRPLLVLLAYQLFRDNEPGDEVLVPAMAVEVFHNFTLMHDDIMDQAPLRRGKPTVHTQWNANVAILSGDVMLVRAYEMFLQVQPERLPVVLKAFNQCAAEVCEGQQWDMNYETAAQVSEANYLAMIRQKTAVLLGFSLELGAILAGASEKDQRQLYEFGEKVGVGFQLMDDWLDVYADQGKFGKQVGGDIIANKKTFLLIKALEQASGTEAEVLNHWLEQKEFESEQKVSAVKKIYQKLDISEQTRSKMNSYFEQGFQALESLSISNERKSTLRDFTKQLMQREK